MEAGLKLERKGLHQDAFKAFQIALDVTFEMVQTVIEKAIKKNLDYIVAPYEADMQIAYLVKEGFADLAITEDSDLVVMGCPITIYKMKADTSYVDEITFKNVIETSDLSSEKMIKQVAVLNGCDYLPGGVPGFGLKKAVGVFKGEQNFENFEEIFEKADGKLKKFEGEFLEKCRTAYLTFEHQVVFCPRLRDRKYFKELRVGIFGVFICAYRIRSKQTNTKHTKK